MQPNVVSLRENNMCSSTITKKKKEEFAYLYEKQKQANRNQNQNLKPTINTLRAMKHFYQWRHFLFWFFFILQVSDTNKSVCLPDSHKVSSKAAHQTDTIINYVYYFVPHAYPPSSTYRIPNRINTMFNSFSNLFHSPLPYTISICIRRCRCI